MKAVVSVEESKILTLRVETIRPFKWQPRTHFDKDRLAELAASLKEFGQQVAVIVKPVPAPDGEVAWELVDGERRWRAAQMAGLSTLRAEVRGAKDDDAQFVASVVSNFGRQDHTAMESARACERVSKMPEYANLPVLKRMDRVGALFARSGQWVQQMLKLMTLPTDVQALMEHPDEGRRLNAQVALQIAQVKDTDKQVSLAKEISAKSLRRAEAGILIGHAIEAQQREHGTRGRPPSDQGRLVYKRVLSLVQIADVLLDMPQQNLRAYFENRQIELDHLVGKLSDGIQSATSVLDALRRLSKRKGAAA
jgi:ParB family chromosome partitioning protein